MNNKLAVYTALFGDYDDLIDPKENFEGCDFICFTDQKHLKSEIWEIRIVENIDLPLNMMNRRYKIFPHLYLSDYEYSMYIDSNIKVVANPIELANKYLKIHDFLMPKHFARNCIYVEAIECINLNKTSHDEAFKQINYYKSKGFPEGYGLGENNILLRNHNKPKVIKLMNEWWNEINKYSKRDQLSLAYILWQNNKRFNYMEESARGSRYFRIKLHLGERKAGLFGNMNNFKNEYLGNYPNRKRSKVIIQVSKLSKKLIAIEHKVTLKLKQ